MQHTAPAPIPTAIVSGPPLTNVDGVASAVSINNDQVASFPFTIPDPKTVPNPSFSGQFHLVHYQSGNNTNATPRVTEQTFSSPRSGCRR